MSEKKHSKGPYLVLLALIGGLLTLLLTILTNSSRTDQRAGTEHPGPQSISQATTQMNQKFDPFKYLPSGSNISNADKHIAYADIDGDGNKEITIFYSTSSGGDHSANILVLKAVGSDYSRLWEDSYEGSQGFTDPTGVYAVNKNGKPQIVAYRTIGASCPGILDIYQYARGAIEKITGDWVGKCQSDLEIKDLNGDGTREIIFRELKYGVNPDIYSWNGKSYLRSNGEFPLYYIDELSKVTESIYSPNPLPTTARTTWCKQACQIVIWQKRYSEGIRICGDVLRMIDDPSVTKPNADLQGSETPETKERVAAYFELRKIQAKEAIYNLLGDVHKAAGHSKEAQLHYHRAQTLKDEAAERESKLPR
jgi:hypothetical protein